MQKKVHSYHVDMPEAQEALDYDARERTNVLIKLQQAAYMPYRAMIAEGFPNLIVAGRCISADRKALASLRVQASCMGMGQAAGMAAAQSLDEGCSVREIDTGRLVASLKEAGAIL